MCAMISKRAGWNYIGMSNTTPNSYDYDKLKTASNMKDMRTISSSDEKTISEDFSDICKKSIIPLPAFVDSEDDTSSESYAPHSDWQGPSGEAWIGK